jgi:hypothetical protein
LSRGRSRRIEYGSRRVDERRSGGFESERDTRTTSNAPQTAGELRMNCERLHCFADIAAVEALFNELAQRSDGVKRLPDQPGSRENRRMRVVRPVQRPTGDGSAIARPSPQPAVMEGRQLRVGDRELDPAEIRGLLEGRGLRRAARRPCRRTPENRITQWVMTEMSSTMTCFRAPAVLPDPRRYSLRTPTANHCGSKETLSMTNLPTPRYSVLSSPEVSML